MAACAPFGSGSSGLEHWSGWRRPRPAQVLAEEFGVATENRSKWLTEQARQLELPGRPRVVQQK